MNHMTKLACLIVLTLSISAHAIKELDQVRQAIKTNNQKTVVVDNGRDFAKRFDQRLVNPGEDHVILMQITGFSGAGIQRADNVAYLEMMVSQLEYFERTYPKYKVLLVAGGTSDGIGSIYEHISDLKKKGKLKNVLTAGTMSRAGAKYAKDLPEMDLLWLVNSYEDDSGNVSWEVSETAGGPSMTIDLFDIFVKHFGSRLYEMHHHVAEGGLQAIQENGELIGRMMDPNFALSRRINLHLHTDIIPQKVGDPKKDKGFYAATASIKFMSELEIPNRLNVVVKPNAREPDHNSYKSPEFTLREFVAKGFDDRTLDKLLDREHIQTQINKAQEDLEKFTAKLEQAEDWDGTYPSTIGSNYSKSKKPIEGIIKQLNLRLPVLQSYMRAIDNLPKAESAFRAAIGKGKSLGGCKGLLQI